MTLNVDILKQNHQNLQVDQYLEYKHKKESYDMILIYLRCVNVTFGLMVS